MKKTPEQKTLEMLGKAKGPLTMAEIAKKLKFDPASNDQHYRGMDNLLRRMKTKHQITFVKGPGGGWRITDVGRKVLADYAPAPKQIKTMPRLTKKPDPVPVTVFPPTPAAPAPASPPPAPLTNHFAIVVDRSTSMDACRTAAEKAVNDNIATIKEQAAKTGQKSTITLVSFSDFASVVYKGADAALAMNFSLQPNGWTALIDGVREGILSLDSMPDKDAKTTSFVVLVITDGEENRSVSCNWETLARMMRERQGTDRWTFAFLVPDEKAKRHLESCGVPVDNIRIWENTAKGTEVMGQATQSAVQSYYTLRSAGMTASKRFFQPDLSKVKPEDIAKLKDIRGECYLWDVKDEAVIQPFVEAKLGHYQPGHGYYPLSKREEVQVGKQIALRDRMTEAIYAGPEARALLGLPNHDVKVEPGDHGKYDIFIQSTSNNRKLVRGSKLLYLK